MMGDKMCLFVPILFSVQLLATDADSSIQFIPKAGQSLQEEIYALYYGACYHSSKSTKEEMCLAGAGCWTEQDKIQWGKGSCPANILEIDWDTKQHLPCGKHCASGMKKSLQDQIYALYGGACYYSSKSTKEEMCLAGAGCWTEQAKIQWGTGSCPADTLEIDWDTAQHLPCGKHCAPGLKKAPQDEIYALYDGACYHSSKSTKDEMCLAGAGCWTEQDKIQWGTGSCPASALEIDWDTAQHLPCGKHCVSDSAMLIV